MSRHARLSRLLLAACGLLLLTSAGCGVPAAQDGSVGVTPRPAVAVDTEWPPVLTASAANDAVSADVALRSMDGEQIRVRAYLVALAPPCETCNVGADRGDGTKVDDRIGKTSRPKGPQARGPEMPGCPPCPPALVTFRDAPVGVSMSPSTEPLHATGSAGALQARHLGHVFVLRGTFHANGAAGPELEVMDVRAVSDVP